MRRLIIIETDDSGRYCHKECKFLRDIELECMLFMAKLNYGKEGVSRCFKCLNSREFSEEIWLQQHKPQKLS